MIPHVIPLDPCHFPILLGKSTGYSNMVGWRPLKDVLKPAWILGFVKIAFDLFPRLFPRFTFDTRF